jgi:hypothetical protein
VDVKKFKGKSYCISFDTLEMPGKIVAVSVELNTIIMGSSDSVRVDLVDHPLYPKLEKYVLDNRGK